MDWAIAPSKPWDADLPNCWAVGARAVAQAGADTFGPITDALGVAQEAAKQAFDTASAYYNNRAAFYSATTINTAGTVGLLVPLRSSIYRGLLGTSEALADAAVAVPLGFFDYNLGKQIVNEVKNPTPCR
jgi:hypothetical protein